MRQKSVALAWTVLLAMTVAPLTSSAEEGVTDDTIRIGGLGALTGPGFLYGKVVMDGAEAIYKEVNDAGGIAGRKIVYVRQDDRCDPAFPRSALPRSLSSTIRCS